MAAFTGKPFAVGGAFALPGSSRGGTSGRSSLIDCAVRLIFEGSTSRPGIRRGSLSRNGRGRCEPAAHSRSASLARRVWASLNARARPGNASDAILIVYSTKGA